ncbi:MAG TPA: riboflavin kinase, partial [bacterium]|nr:riboflavin kinase [bacterium]
GRREGRKLGYPTANLALPDYKLRPAFGVYISRVEVPSGSYYAATNVGIRPTFGPGGTPSVEAHLLDFSGDLYGAPMTLHFLEYLRPERRFTDLGALREQLGKDVDAVARYAAEA